MKYHNASQKLFKAVQSLRSARTIKERMTSAISEIDYLRRGDEVDLPPEMVENYRRLMNDMTSVKSSTNEGTIIATVKTMSDTNLERKAKDVLELYTAIKRYNNLS